MKKHVISVVTLVAIVGVMALLLAGTNALTAPVIEKNQSAAANAALLEVMPEGTGFEAVDLSTYELPATVTEVHKETEGKGYVVKLTTKGYGSDFVIMCGVSAEGTVTGAVCLSSNETLSKEKEYGANFTGKDAAAVEATDTIAGATMTTSAYKNAVKDALNTAIILGGGSVDIRTPEQILADNLNAALPEGEGAFTPLFFTTEVEGVDKIYAATNGTGHVAVIGEEFVAVKADGTSDNKAAADGVAALTADTLTPLDLSTEGLHQNITKAEITASGNYVFEIKGAGYGIKGGDDYHPASGEYIMIKVCLTPAGKILDCVTLSQAETQNLGDACAKEEFYGQFDGKTADTLESVDAISGATLTTKGYIEALQRCIDSVAALEGGAK